MSKIEPIDLLARARENEKNYDWIAAVEFHEKALDHSLQQRDLLRAGEVAERIGYCFHRAAMQAKSRDEFEKKIELAIGSYQRAQEIYESLPDSQKAGRKLRSKAVATYLNYWLASNGVEKRKLLDECLELEGEALTQFLHSGNMLEYCRTYNALWLVFYLRGYLEWDVGALLRLVRKGIEWGEKAISALSEIDNLHEVAWSYFVYTSCLSFIASSGIMKVSIVEIEEAETNSSKLIAAIEKALFLSEKLGDSFLTGLFDFWLGCNMDLRSDRRFKFEKTLSLGVLTRDNFLIGACLEILAEDTFWTAFVNPAKAERSLEIAKGFYDRAQKHNLITRLCCTLGGEMTAPHGCAAYYREKAIGWGSDPQKRLDFLNMAEKAAVEAMETALHSDMPRVIAGSSHCLSCILVELARLESNPRKRKDLLKRAIACRERFIRIVEQLEPFDYFSSGVGLSHLAENKALLAEVESNLQVKERLLIEAVAHSEKGLELYGRLIPYCEKIGDFDHLPVLGRIIDRFEVALTNLHDLTRQSDTLRRTIEILHSSINTAKKQGIVEVEATSYWKIARAQDALEEHLEAAESFNHASESYLETAKRIPQLKDFYEKQASYMQAWSEIEKAKEAHAREQYDLAKTHYEKAAILHESTTQWSYLSSNYSAWAQLEEAEELSRSEKAEESREAFVEAARLFEESGKLIQPKLGTPLTREERELANSLLKASGKRRQYCLGRIALEEAKVQDRRGDHLRSSKKYSLAAKIFEMMMEGEEERSRRQLLPIFYLCQAWARMMVAEETASPRSYEEAAELFNKAREHSLDRETRLLALANSSFCKGLASGTDFEISRDMKAYSKAKRHMEVAENCYLKAKQEPASEYANATLKLLDGYMYTTKAETDTEPTEKAKYYNMAERMLNASIDSYLRAGRPERSAEVQSILENIIERRQLTVSFMSVLQDPTITATTKSFSAPTPTFEEAVGSERFEHAELEANLAISEEAAVGESIEAKLDIVNVGRQAALLLRVQSIVPSGFEVTSSSSQSEIEGDLVNLKGKRIEPFSINSIRLAVQTSESGIFNLKPQISYVDDLGNFKQCLVKPATLLVRPKLELEFGTDAARKVYEYLVKSFVEDYMKRKLTLQKSGWRSLVQIMKNAKVSSRKVYGSKRLPGRTISELEKRGLIEKRTFLGERGRGGKIFRTRICYEREIVKRLVDQKVAKNE